MLVVTLIAAAALPIFTCDVIKVHDGDGPLWCRSGEKIRVAGIQARDFESAEPCRRLDAGGRTTPATIGRLNERSASCPA